jgi:hypothetical protein
MAMVRTTVNLPPQLMQALQARSAHSGQDATALIVQALLEMFAIVDVGAATAVDSISRFKNGATCSICGAERLAEFIVLMDEPLITVCTPWCADTGGPVDAHGQRLAVGDEVISCLGADGPLTGKISALSMDASGDPVASLIFPDASRPYRQRCRTLQKSGKMAQSARHAATRPKHRP